MTTGTSARCNAPNTDGDSVNHVLCTCATSGLCSATAPRIVRALAGFHGARARLTAALAPSALLTECSMTS